MDTPTLPALFRLLSDPVRLRALGVLDQAELAVSELAKVLGLSASRLGNHLRILREAGAIVDRREGNWTFVSIDRDGPLLTRVWEAVREAWQESEDHRVDAERLAEVLEERRARSRAYFDRAAARWDVAGSDLRSGVARERVAASLVPRTLTVADVGCGTGYLASGLAPLVKRLILVDHAPAMLDAARENLTGSAAELDFRTGEIDALPLGDSEVDALVCSMVLHHAPDLSAFFREAWRALRPGGTLVTLDLLPHKEVALRDHMADLRLGLDPQAVTTKLTEAGFTRPVVERPSDAYCPAIVSDPPIELPVFLLRCHKAET